MEPLVSVIIPTLPKRKELLERAIRSVKDQTYKNIEIIPVVEGDNACEARNIGTSKAKGEFVAYLDDDDTWYPTKIEKQVQYLIDHPQVPLVICYSDDKRRQDGRISRPPQIVDHKELIKGFNLSSTSSYVVRKSILEKVYDIKINNRIVDKCEGCKQIFKCWADYELGIWKNKDLICDDIRKELGKHNFKRYFDEDAPSGHEYDLALRITNLPPMEYIRKDGKVVCNVIEPQNIHCIPEILMTQYKTPGQISENWGRKVRGQYFMMHKWGHEYGLMEWLKRIGLIGLFFAGYFFGDYVMYPINFMKARFEA
jgi:glycosyltransferase involved in cell wall biosynthesis